MGHVQHDTTGEWRFDVGAGWVNPPWVPQSGTAADLAKNKVIRFREIDARTAFLIVTNPFTYLSKKFSNTLEAQVKRCQLKMSSGQWTYPVKIRTYDDLDEVSFADTAAIDAFYDAGSQAMIDETEAGDAYKVSINSAVDQAALDAVVDTR